VHLPVLGSHFKDIVGRYHGPEGDVFALEELAPVAARFLDRDSTVLEVGCGYGRNLMALASLKPRLVVGSDVDPGELQRAADKRASLPESEYARIELVRQEPAGCRFRDGTFDMVVLWQVLEHLFGQELKQTVVSECVRVLKPGGYVLVETPNQWFPVDYHDNKLPFVHWFLPLPGARMAHAPRARDEVPPL
jgi:SAM-dependent methyltransferase